MERKHPPSDLFRAFAHLTSDSILGKEGVNKVLDAMDLEARTEDVECEVIVPKELPSNAA